MNDPRNGLGGYKELQQWVMKTLHLHEEYNTLVKYAMRHFGTKIKNGDSFLLEMPFCNTDSFQIFLEEFALQKPEEFEIIVLDNGAFHKAKRLHIPSNICLVFLPPYCPELNPSEKMWALFKRNFTNQLFEHLDQIGEFISDCIKNITPEQMITICNFDYAFVPIIWTIL